MLLLSLCALHIYTFNYCHNSTGRLLLLFSAGEDRVMLLKPKPSHTLSLLTSFPWLLCHSRQSQSLFCSSEGLCVLPLPLTASPASPLLTPLPPGGFLEHAGCFPASGPLHRQLPLPRIFFLQISIKLTPSS